MEEESLQLEADRELADGLRFLRSGETAHALRHFEKAVRLGAGTEASSHLAYLAARERGQVKAGIDSLRALADQDPGNPVHWLNLGRVLLLGENKADAVKAFRQGMAGGGLPEIVAELEQLGIRRRPLFPALRRGNPLNRYLGLLLYRLGMRRA